MIENLLASLEWQVRGERPRFVVQAEQPATTPGYLAFLVPGLVGMAIMIGGLERGGIQIARLRERQVLKHLLATPLRPGVFAAAWTVVFMGSLIVRLVLLMLVAVTLFGFPLRGHLPSAVMISLLGAMLFMAIGLVVATFVRRVLTAQAVIQVVALPIYFFSETFFSLRGGPQWLSAVVTAMPLTPLNEALRAVLTHGQTLAGVWPQVVTLLLWLGVCIVLLAWRLRDPSRIIG
jgi:ABC-type multidrug transport system permease subunit